MNRRTLAMLVILLATGAVLVWAVPAMLNPPPQVLGDVNTGRVPLVGDARSAPESVPPASSNGPAAGRAVPAERGDAPATAGEGDEWRRLDEREVTIPAGTPLSVRLTEALGSDSARVEDAVIARLAVPVILHGRTVLPANSEVRGRVTAARRSGKVRGRAYLAMRFTEVRLADGERYSMRTRPWAREAPATKRKDAAKIAVPAGAGAVVGGIVGGKKGAGIGAAVGGGAGTGVVLSTRGEEVRVNRGARLTVRLAEPLTVRLRS